MPKEPGSVFGTRFLCETQMTKEPGAHKSTWDGMNKNIRKHVRVDINTKLRHFSRTKASGRCYIDGRRAAPRRGAGQDIDAIAV